MKGMVTRMAEIMKATIKLDNDCRKCVVNKAKAIIKRYKWRKAMKCGRR